jgi:hypothetical protein
LVRDKKYSRQRGSEPREIFLLTNKIGLQYSKGYHARTIVCIRMREEELQKSYRHTWFHSTDPGIDTDTLQSLCYSEFPIYISHIYPHSSRRKIQVCILNKKFK